MPSSYRGTRRHVVSNPLVNKGESHGRTLPINYKINDNLYRMGYYLADCIYLRNAMIVKSMKKSNLENERFFFKSIRKHKKGCGTCFWHSTCAVCNHSSTREVRN